MIAAGENPKAVQEFLGHATITMTFDRYGHLMPGSRDQARARVDAYLADSHDRQGEVVAGRSLGRVSSQAAVSCTLG